MLCLHATLTTTLYYVVVRLHPRNSHQLPHVVVLVCPHTVGAKGLATARCLANQNVQVHVFIAGGFKVNMYILIKLTTVIIILTLQIYIHALGPLTQFYLGRLLQIKVLANLTALYHFLSLDQKPKGHCVIIMLV